MSRIRVIVLAAALSLFAVAVVTGVVVKLSTVVSLAGARPVATQEPSGGGASQSPSASPTDPTSTPTASAPPSDPGAAGGDDPGESGTGTGGGGGTGGGSAAPPSGPIVLPPPPPPPPLGPPAQIDAMGGSPYPATCGQSFTIWADVSDDTAVVSAVAYMEGVAYSMSTDDGSGW